MLSPTKADLQTESERAEFQHFLCCRPAPNAGVTMACQCSSQLDQTQLVPSRNDPWWKVSSKRRFAQHGGVAAEQILRHKLVFSSDCVARALDYLRVALVAGEPRARRFVAGVHDRLLERARAISRRAPRRETCNLLAHDVAGQALEQSMQRLQPIQ